MENIHMIVDTENGRGPSIKDVWSDQKGRGCVNKSEWREGGVDQRPDVHKRNHFFPFRSSYRCPTHPPSPSTSQICMRFGHYRATQSGRLWRGGFFQTNDDGQGGRGPISHFLLGRRWQGRPKRTYDKTDPIWTIPEVNANVRLSLKVFLEVLARLCCYAVGEL